MPVSRGAAPVIVEVRPSNAGGSSNIAPSSPRPSSLSPPGSPKKGVRFASTESQSRQLTPTEAWSLYHFENHARACPDCRDPVGVHLRGAQLCHTGHALAQDVAIHVYHHAGEVYSAKDNHKHVRLELPPGYDQVRGLVKCMDRMIRSAQRTTPIISYDANYPISPRRTSPAGVPQYNPEEGRTEVLIQPSSSKPERKSSKREPTTSKSKSKDRGYKTVVVEDEIEVAEPESPTRTRRGSLYDTDKKAERREQGYRVVYRQPNEQRRKEERRKGDRYL